jgi:hypothetical protein
MCSMVCTEGPNQIKFVSRPHPTGSRTDFIYTDFGVAYGLPYFLTTQGTRTSGVWCRISFLVVLRPSFPPEDIVSVCTRNCTANYKGGRVKKMK